MAVYKDYLEDLKRADTQSVEFGILSCKEIEKLSVAKIVTPLTFNALGHPLPGGLYDSALGPYEDYTPCETCGETLTNCRGHFGHIESPLPLYNPAFNKPIVSLLKICCLSCFRIVISSYWKQVFLAQIKLLNANLTCEAENLTTELGVGDSGSSASNSVNCVEEYLNNTLAKRKLSVTKDVVKGESDQRNAFVKQFLLRMDGKKCPHCANTLRKITVLRGKTFITAKLEVASKFQDSSSKQVKSTSDRQTMLMASECQRYLREIWKNDSQIFEALFPVLRGSTEEYPSDLLFMNIIPVTPTNTRPVNIVGSMVSEHPLNTIYKSILNGCLMIKSIVHLMKNTDQDFMDTERKEIVGKLRGSTYTEKLQFLWEELQTDVDSLLDAEAKRVRNYNGIGLKQIIEKKVGIIRMNMMGKRVNYAARTVITPDPNLDVDEIGVPEVFAKKLTFPVPVTTWNVEYLRKLVLNGPEVHPGANTIKLEDGKIIKLSPSNRTQRVAIAKQLLTPGIKKGIKVLHRHLVNGDILLLNRQPTLHRPSIMGHRARILKGEKTFRLHYANCKSYNADFDGDEMNAHFPQSEIARSEAYNIVSACHQYLVPKDGTPLSGLIQDHVVSGVRLSIRGKFFTRQEYMLLTFQALSSLSGNIKTLPPAIQKPQALWSGKQLISTVILNVIPSEVHAINLTSTAKISSKAWEIPGFSHKKWTAGGTPYKDQKTMSESEVIIRGGLLLSGVLDKMHYGATPYGLVHCVYELYGGQVSSKLLSCLAKLFTVFLQIEGFTLGVQDILVKPDADKMRERHIQKLREIGTEVVAKALGQEYNPTKDYSQDLGEAHRKIPMFRAILDHEYKAALNTWNNSINKECVPNGLISPFPANNLQLMVQSGAKGSTVNTMQISSLLGQIELEGKRPPIMISGRTLPSFKPYDVTPRAGGFIDGRFMTGIQPQEFFFHCMAGREGLIDTAVKTSRSGYLQRCLVKHLEGIRVNYDMTVRDSDGSMVQFAYGEDGMDIGQSQFLTPNQLPFLVENINAIRNEKTIEEVRMSSDLPGIKKWKKNIRKYRNHQSDLRRLRGSPFTVFSKEMEELIPRSQEISDSCSRFAKNVQATNMWLSLDTESKAKYAKKWKTPPDPVVSKFQSDRHLGAITERLEMLIDNFLNKYEGSCPGVDIREMMEQKAMMACSPPGEPVGLLAAQSIGEPSTQMTLNTFHFAGRGEMNVTLGIPRLREIIMVASKCIKTPTMEIPFHSDLPKLEKESNKLRKSMKKVTVGEVLEFIEVTEKTNPLTRTHVYILKMQFLPHEAYKDMCNLRGKTILKHVERNFIKQLTMAIVKTKGKGGDIISESSEAKTGGRAVSDDEDDKNEDNDGESGMSRQRKKKLVGTTDDYQSSDEEEEDGDDDATTARRRMRQQEEQQYSDMEDELDDETRLEIGEEEETFFSDREGNQGETKNDEEEDAKRQAVVHANAAVQAYNYDTQHHSWCEITLQFGVSHRRVNFSSILKDVAYKSVITEVNGIKQAFVNVQPDGTHVLKTDGLNFGAVYKYPQILDLNKLYSNDIHAVANTYGIEAATKVLVKEIQNVFKVYGITVDSRHLTLVADYMTFSGTYLPMNWKGLEGCGSPLQQMSFEASLTFLKSFVIQGSVDHLDSPSSRLMLGLPCKTGTGSFKLLQKIPIR